MKQDARTELLFKATQRLKRFQGHRPYFRRSGQAYGYCFPIPPSGTGGIPGSVNADVHACAVPAHQKGAASRQMAQAGQRLPLHDSLRAGIQAGIPIRHAFHRNAGLLPFPARHGKPYFLVRCVAGTAQGRHGQNAAVFQAVCMPRHHILLPVQGHAYGAAVTQNAPDMERRAPLYSPVHNSLPQQMVGQQAHIPCLVTVSLQRIK